MRFLFFIRLKRVNPDMEQKYLPFRILQMMVTAEEAGTIKSFDDAFGRM